MTGIAARDISRTQPCTKSFRLSAIAPACSLFFGSFRWGYCIQPKLCARLIFLLFSVVSFHGCLCFLAHFEPTPPAKPSPIPALFPALIGEARAGLRSVFIVLECIWYFSVHSSNFRFADAVSPTQPPRKAADCPMHTFSASLQKCASSVYGLPSLPFVTRTG